MADILTLNDAISLQTILVAAQSNARVRWIDDNSHGEIRDGVARHLVKDPENAYFLTETDDVRDAYLRVSSTFEHFLPVRDLLLMVRGGTFVIDHERTSS